MILTKRRNANYYDPSFLAAPCKRDHVKINFILKNEFLATKTQEQACSVQLEA